MTPSTALADRFVLIFTAKFCHYCPEAKAMLMDLETNKLLEPYKKAYEVDIQKYPNVKERFNITSIPVILVVETEKDSKIMSASTKILEKWTLTSDREYDKIRLRDFLKRLVPKKLQRFKIFAFSNGR